jgi:Ser/Thr protein kinase RdoA (MazF antagonist)
MPYQFRPAHVVQVRDDAIVKKAEPERMRLEVEKTRRAYEIGKATGLFRAPRVLQFDEAAGQAEFERLPGLRSAADVFAAGGSGHRLALRAGEVLAAIHRDLTLPDDMVRLLPPELRLPAARRVFLHGDFTVDNVCENPDGGVAIIDWQTSDWCGGDATYGTPCFDVAWFVASLFGTRMHRYWGRRSPEHCARLFLSGYLGAASTRVDRKELRDYLNRVSRFVRAFRRDRWRPKSRLGLLPMVLRLWVFVNSVRLR